MNIDDHVEATLKFFEKEAGILDEILFIGAWARYFYRSLFKGKADYQARLATKDLDILLQRKKKMQALTVNLHQKLVDAGYRSNHLPSNLIKYNRDDLELEFLIPPLGRAKDDPVKVRAYNVTAVELAYLQMLWDHPVVVRYGTYRVNVPDPVDYAIHKLIISYRRRKAASGEQDRRDAEEVLYALRDDRVFEKRIQQGVAGLKPKALKGVRDGIATFLLPDFRERLAQLVAICTLK